MNDKADHGIAAGIFEYIEAKIRRDVDNTSFGFDFERLCKWYLETAPQYKALIKRVWLWRDWPDRWGPDTGIDLVCEAKDGKLWAVQAKAWRSDLTIAKAEVDACFVKGSVNKAKLKLTYPDYFFATTP